MLIQFKVEISPGYYKFVKLVLNSMSSLFPKDVLEGGGLPGHLMRWSIPEKNIHPVLRNTKMFGNDGEEVCSMDLVLISTHLANTHKLGICTWCIRPTKHHGHIRDYLHHHVLLRLSGGGCQGLAQLSQASFHVRNLVSGDIGLDTEIWHFHKRFS